MKFFTITLIFLALIPSVRAENRLVLMPGTLYFDYEETDEDGSFLDGESDPVPGFSAQLKFKNKFGAGFLVHGGVHSGTVDYDGHALPSGLPAYSSTKANFFSLGAMALFPARDGNLDLELQLGYQHKRWERDIQSTVVPSLGRVPGLYEVYKWEEFSMGMEAIVDRPKSHQWRFYAGIFQTINPRIIIDLSADGDGKPRLFMGSDIGYNASAQLLFKSRSRWDAGVKLSYKTWRFDRSNSAVVSGGTITEPDSRTHIILFEFLLATDI